MRAKRWIYWTAWCGLVLMGMLVVTPVEAQRGGGVVVGVGEEVVGVGVVVEVVVGVVVVVSFPQRRGQ